MDNAILDIADKVQIIKFTEIIRSLETLVRDMEVDGFTVACAFTLLTLEWLVLVCTHQP